MGARLAKRAVDRIPQHQFRRIVAVFLLVVGLKLLILPRPAAQQPDVADEASQITTSVLIPPEAGVMLRW
jgi:hypothetical protein